MLFFVHLNLNLTGHPVLLFGKSGNPSLGVKLTPPPPHSFLHSVRCIWVPYKHGEWHPWIMSIETYTKSTEYFLASLVNLSPTSLLLCKQWGHQIGLMLTLEYIMQSCSKILKCSSVASTWRELVIVTHGGIGMHSRESWKPHHLCRKLPHYSWSRLSREGRSYGWPDFPSRKINT